MSHKNNIKIYKIDFYSYLISEGIEINKHIIDDSTFQNKMFSLEYLE